MTTTELESLRRQYDRRESKQTGVNFAGLEFDTELVSSAGCCVFLYAPEGTTPEAIEAAKDAATTARDVVYFEVVPIPADWIEKPYAPATEHKAGWIAAARWIKENRQFRRVIPETGELVPEKKRGGIMLDLFTASAMVTVYDALNDANKAKVNAMDVRVAANICMKLIK